MNHREIILEALKGLLYYVERNTCQHEETYRGGSIWEICSLCGAKWADDQGGKPEWKDPPEWVAAEKAINLLCEGTDTGPREHTIEIKIANGNIVSIKNQV